MATTVTYEYQIVGYLWSGNKVAYQRTLPTFYEDCFDLKAVCGDFDMIKDYECTRVTKTINSKDIGPDEFETVETTNYKVVKPWYVRDNADFYLEETA